MTNIIENCERKSCFVMRMREILTRNDFIALRRAFGIPLADAGGLALIAFYKVYPQDEQKEEAVFLAACAIAYILHYGNGNKSFPLCLKEAKISESRIKSLLSNKRVDRDGFFHSKYSRLIRYVVSKGYLPNINGIYPALINWWKYRVTFIREYYKK